MPTLFDPIQLGDLALPNRILMAPLTRMRADADTRVPTSVMRDHYVQRASAGLIISEATSVDPMGVGYVATPGIWSPEQVAGWRQVTDGVHRAGGRMVLQLWHVGRISDPSLLGGLPPVAPSAIAAVGHVSQLRPKRPYPTPRALDADEIPAIIEAFRRGAQNAEKAGFDGVEIHGANGYLLDQFLQDSSNDRTDGYGGSVENRARLMLEATDAAIGVWGSGRVGVHIAPRADMHGMSDSDPLATFGYLARALGERKIAFLFAREHLGDDRIGPALKQAFGGPFIANEKFTIEDSEAELTEGRADAIAFGMKYIANPDLVDRIRSGAELNPVVAETIYAKGAEGYTDYPAMAA